jgi:hypothetical protein
LPAYAVVEGKPANIAGMAALGLALARELSGEGQLERAQQAECRCERSAERVDAGADASSRENNQRIYIEAADHRFQGVRRCC